MKREKMIWGLMLILALSGALPAWGGSPTANDWLYLPGIGARGTAEKDLFDAGLGRLDARLAKEIWVGDPNYGPTFQEALTTIDSTPAILRVPAGTYNIDANLPIPANITIKPERGAIFAIATDQTLTINGSIDAGPWQIFSCADTGAVSLGAGAAKEVCPEWWGIDGTADQTEINAAIAACPTGAAVALSRTYATTGTVTLGTGSVLISRGAKIDGNYGGILVSMGHKSKILGHLEIDGNGVASSVGIQYGPGAVYWTWIESAYVHHCAAIGVYLYSNYDSGVYYNTAGFLQIDNCGDGMKFYTVQTPPDETMAKVNSNGFNLVSIQTCTNGIVIDNAEGNNFNHLEVESCGAGASGWGIDLVKGKGFHVGGGWLEKNGATAGSTQDLRIANAPDVRDVDIAAIATKLFYSPTYSDGDTDGSTGVITGFASVNGYFVGQKVTVSAGFATTGPFTITGVTSTTFDPPDPANTITVDANSNAAVNNVTTTGVPSLSYTYSASRSVSIQAGQYERKLGATLAERLDIGPAGAAADDLSAYDRLRVAGGQYCYRFSSGNPYYFFSAPTAGVGFSFRNNTTNEILRIVGNSPGTNQTSLYLLMHNGSGVSLQRVLLGADDSGGSGYKALVIPNP